ncbi:MAG: tetratricopeptide repeat protein [Bacteroidota bacterium]
MKIYFQKKNHLTFLFLLISLNCFSMIDKNENLFELDTIGKGFYEKANIAFSKGDMNQTFTLMKKSADLGYDQGIYNLSILYLNGIGVEANAEKGISTLEFAARRGLPEARIYWYSFNKLYGKDVNFGLTRNTVRSWIEEDARTGISESQIYLGSILLENDLGDAAKWFKKGTSNSSVVDVEIYRKVGDFLKYGLISELKESDQVNKEIEADLEYYYTKAAELGDHDACFQAGLYFTEKDRIIYDNWKSANSFVSSGTAKPKGVSYNKAFSWWKKGGDKGNIDCLKEIAYLFKNGSEVLNWPMDLNKSLEFYSLAVKNGSLRSAVEIADIHRLYTKDYKKAMEYYLQVVSKEDEVESGDLSYTDFGYVLSHISEMYLEGNGVPKDKKEGKKWLIRAYEDYGVGEADLEDLGYFKNK